MTASSAMACAQLSGMLVFGTAARWYVMPWLKSQPRATALTPLLWIHAFRGVALQLYAAQAAGFRISDSVRDHNIVGDVLGMMLALTALVGLRYRIRYATALVWLLVVETIADLATGLPKAFQEHAMGSASGVTWLVLVYYAPLVMISTALIVWQLVSRRSESIQFEALRTGVPMPLPS